MSSEPQIQHFGFGRGFLANLKKIIVGIFTLIGAIASIVAIWTYYKSGKPRIDAIITRVEHLTSPSVDGKLSVSYQFDRKPVANLWRVRLTLTNTSNETVIATEGPRQIVTNGHLPIILKDKTEILNFLVERNDAAVIASRPKVIPTPANPNPPIPTNALWLTFEQWRSKESVVVELYLEMDENAAPSLKIFEAGRPIIDGFFEYRVPDDELRQKKPVLDYLPASVALTIRIILSGSSVLFIVLCVLAIISTLNEAGKREEIHKWQLQHLAAATTHLQQKISADKYTALAFEHFHVTDKMFERLTGQPKSGIWTGFEGAPKELRWLRSEPSGMKSETALFIVLFSLIIAINFAISAAIWSV